MTNAVDIVSIAAHLYGVTNTVKRSGLFHHIELAVAQARLGHTNRAVLDYCWGAKDMAQALHRPTGLKIPPRDKSQVALPHSALGNHKEQVRTAFAKMFQRYEKTLEELAKV